MSGTTKAIIILCLLLIVASIIYSYRAPIKTALEAGALGLAGYLAVGGTIAGYKLYKAYKAAGIAKDTATIETEAAAGATEVSAAGEATTAAGEVIADSTVAGEAATAAEGAVTLTEGGGAFAEIGLFLEELAPLAIL